LDLLRLLLLLLLFLLPVLRVNKAYILISHIKFVNGLQQSESENSSVSREQMSLATLVPPFLKNFDVVHRLVSCFGCNFHSQILSFMLYLFCNKTLQCVRVQHESVQQRATKLVTGMQGLQYNESETVGFNAVMFCASEVTTLRRYTNLFIIIIIKKRRVRICDGVSEFGEY